MKRMIAFAAAVPLLTAPALAGDLYSPANLLPGSKDIAGTSVNWERAYIGGQAGYGMGTTGVTISDVASVGGISSRGALGGVNGGVDIKRGPFVLGVLADYNWSDEKFTASAAGGGNPLPGSLKTGGTWFAGARAGILPAKQVLLYGLAGVSGTRITAGGGSDSMSKDLTGFTAGAGVEYQFLRGVSGFAEYHHGWYDGVTWAEGVKTTYGSDAVFAGVKLGIVDLVR